jgi:pyruvate/2-oxoglutarate dehydrogenase complex dihydrolipoamide dehydrogenase (E3) component
MTGVYGTIQVDRRYQTNAPGIYAIGTVIMPSLDRVDPAAMRKELALHLPGG